MRVLITGGTGFIGLHVCRALVARGDHVVALARSKAKARELPPEVEVLEGDLSIFRKDEATLPAVDVVVHLAGVVAANHPDEYEAINFGSVKDLVERLTRTTPPRRLVFASSLAAAGPSPPDVAHTESDPPRPIDPYGDAKARAEVVVGGAPFPTTSFRPPIVLGPGDTASLTLFKSAQSGIGFRVAGAPQRLSFVDVRDLVSAILLMIDDTRPGSFVYFASHPQVMDVKELWRELGNAVGRKVLVVPLAKWVLYVAMLVSTFVTRLFRFTNQLDDKQYRQMTAPAFVCSSERLRTELGWAPKHDLRDTLTNAAAGYRKLGWIR